MTKDCGSSATKSAKVPARHRSMSAQIPQGRAVAPPPAPSAPSCGAIRVLRRHLDQLYRRMLEHFAHGMQLVFAAIEDRADAGVDEHLEAVDAGCVSHVDVRVADRGAVLRRLSDRVNLGMDGAPAILLDLAVGRMRFVDEASGLRAMRHPGRRAIVAGGQDAA